MPGVLVFWAFCAILVKMEHDKIDCFFEWLQLRHFIIRGRLSYPQ